MTESISVTPHPEAVALLPFALAARFLVVPLAVEGNQIRVAMRDPGDFEALDYIELVTKKRPIGVKVAEERIRELLPRAYRGHGATTELEATAAEATRIAQAGAEGTELPIVRLVDQILAEAVRMRATDIHLQPEETELLVRLRIDGVLQVVLRLPKALHQPVSTRVKVLSGLDISDRRLPQDGKYELELGGKRLDFRVSTTPTINGENVVLRILDRGTVQLGFSELGFARDEIERIERLVHRPHGIFLVTGPTGSGKTTSLYSSLRLLDTERYNIMTLEDPVEYRLPGIRQSQISEKAGFTFASGLRALMRQDPDIILVGEIRDLETAEIAMRASLTGHLVLSTLHTNGALATLTRLRDMGVPSFLVGTTICGVMAQRLLRRLCRHCAEPAAATPEELRYLGLAEGDPVRLFRAVGCEECHQHGYRGRFAVYELLEMSDGVRAGLATDRTAAELENIARDEGFETIREHAARKVALGLTSVEEMARVLGS